MKLAAPFVGDIFEQMFSQDVETVTREILKAYSVVSGSQLGTLQDAVSSVMRSLLQAVAFDGMPSYVFGGADNSQLLSHVVALSGVDATLAETIVSGIYTEDVLGNVSHWYGDIAGTIARAKTSRAEWQALQPSFLQRVAGTIFAPLGITGEKAILYVQILIGLGAVLVVAYIWRSFR